MDTPVNIIDSLPTCSLRETKIHTVYTVLVCNLNIYNDKDTTMIIIDSNICPFGVGVRGLTVFLITNWIYLLNLL